MPLLTNDDFVLFATKSGRIVGATKGSQRVIGDVDLEETDVCITNILDPTALDTLLKMAGECSVRAAAGGASSVKVSRSVKASWTIKALPAPSPDRTLTHSCKDFTLTRTRTTARSKLRLLNVVVSPQTQFHNVSEGYVLQNERGRRSTTDAANTGVALSRTLPIVATMHITHFRADGTKSNTLTGTGAYLTSQRAQSLGYVEVV